MSNVLDYIDWRGDLSFIQSPFNEIDNLILSRVSYLPFDKIIEKDETVTIHDLYKRFQKLDKTTIRMLQVEDADLFPAIAKSKRFGDLFIKNYVNNRDLEQEKQFSAITIIIPDGTAYVAYRGTDNTLIGWKEDFETAKHLTGNLRVGGHSKGGNLAIYASAFCDKDVQDRIIEVYNNDGPGFFEEIIETENYQRILPKIHTYIPQTSIFGRMLNHEEKFTVVESAETGVYQHSLYSWQLVGTKFIDMKKVTKESEFIDKTLKTWLKTVDAEQRKKFWFTLYEIVTSTNAETVAELNDNWFVNYKKIFASYKNLDAEGREIINQTIKVLFGIAKDNIKPKRKNSDEI